MFLCCTILFWAFFLLIYSYILICALGLSTHHTQLANLAEYYVLKMDSDQSNKHGKKVVHSYHTFLVELIIWY